MPLMNTTDFFFIHLTLFEIYFKIYFKKYFNLKYILNKNILQIYKNTLKNFIPTLR